MRPKKPIHVLIDQVRITREGNDAIIDHAEPNLSGARITGIATMTDAEIVESTFSPSVGAPGGVGQDGRRRTAGRAADRLPREQRSMGPHGSA
jgi:hypothetical protein